MHPVWCVVFACIIAGPCEAFTISEFCPDPSDPGDLGEYVVLSGPGPLDGVVVSDGEGSAAFPVGSLSGGRVVAARSAAAYRKLHGAPPDFEWTGSDPGVRDMVVTGSFRLANNRDELVLLENGRVSDRISWPGDVTPREARIHVFREGVWDPRVMMEGQSDLPPVTFEEAVVHAGVAPDVSRGLFRDVVSGATRELEVNVYEFTSVPMARDLTEASARGVTVTVLLEGGPVGGISNQEKHVIQILLDGGVRVFQTGTVGAGRAPYRYDHAKYVVADRSVLFVSSENFGANGFPEGPYSGNRGWVVIVRHSAAASYCSDMFREDLQAPTVTAYPPTRGLPEEPVTGRYEPEFPQEVFEHVTVTPVIAPDTTDLLEESLRTAGRSIDIEQAYIKNETRGGWNRFLSGAINASRRGVSVRVLLDSYWFNTGDEADNDEMVEAINRLAREEHLPLTARCADLEGNNLVKIHNKGVIIDRKKVLVSSMNWNTNSPDNNREVGLLLESPEVGSYYSRVFEDDWQAGSFGVQVSEFSSFARYLLATGIIGFLVVVYLLRRRRSL